MGGNAAKKAGGGIHGRGALGIDENILDEEVGAHPPREVPHKFHAGLEDGAQAQMRGTTTKIQTNKLRTKKGKALDPILGRSNTRHPSRICATGVPLRVAALGAVVFSALVGG